MDLVQRINDHFAESAKVKLATVSTLAEPLKQASERKRPYTEDDRSDAGEFLTSGGILPDV